MKQTAHEVKFGDDRVLWRFSLFLATQPEHFHEESEEGPWAVIVGNDIHRQYEIAGSTASLIPTGKTAEFDLSDSAMVGLVYAIADIGVQQEINILPYVAELNLS